MKGFAETHFARLQYVIKASTPADLFTFSHTDTTQKVQYFLLILYVKQIIMKWREIYK